jgi:hypothetical protein
MTPRFNVTISDLSNEVFSLRLAQILNFRLQWKVCIDPVSGT